MKMSPRHRGLLLALSMMAPLAFSPFAAWAQKPEPAAPQDYGTALALRDSRFWSGIRPAEEDGVTRIELHYSGNVTRRIAIGGGEMPAFDRAILTPGDKNWDAVHKAIYESQFSLREDRTNFADWAVYVYTDRGLTRAITFKVYPNIQSYPGSLGFDRVSLRGPLPQLLEKLRLEGELKFNPMP